MHGGAVNSSPKASAGRGKRYISRLLKQIAVPAPQLRGRHHLQACIGCNRSRPFDLEVGITTSHATTTLPAPTNASSARSAGNHWGSEGHVGGAAYPPPAWRRRRTSACGGSPARTFPGPRRPQPSASSGLRGFRLGGLAPNSSRAPGPCTQQVLKRFHSARQTLTGVQCLYRGIR